MHQQIVDTLDRIFPFLFFLPAAGMAFYIMKAFKYRRTRRRVGDRYVYEGRFPWKSLVFAFLTFLPVVMAETVVDRQAASEVRLYLDGVRNTQVTINGRPALHPDAVIEALQKPAHFMAHHSHPEHNLHIVIHSNRGELVLDAGRDSQEAQEYWIMYPHYRTTASNAIYKIRTAVLDGF